jgi:type II secretory ATPase GspE/PulE/Tfp pilus assembly ATPase PilB-like protein
MDEKVETETMEKPTESKIIEAAKSQETLNMRQDGILKALRGITTLDELQRVVEIE